MAIKWIAWKKWKILRKVQSSKTEPGKIEIMNNPITITEIEAVIKKISQKTEPRTRWLHRRILSNI